MLLEDVSPTIGDFTYYNFSYAKKISKVVISSAEGAFDDFCFEVAGGGDCFETVPSDHWKGEYYNNMNLEGSPSMVRDDGTGFLNFDWGYTSPSTKCGINSDFFSVRWTRSVYFDSGTRRFTATTDDGMRLYVDGSLLIDKWFNQAPTTYTADIDLTAGTHTIKVEYYEYDQTAVAKLSWEKVGENKPDLIIQDISWNPENPKEGENITYSVKVKNIGKASAGGSTVKYYIDGSYIASDSVPALSAGSISTQTFTWTANKCGNIQVKAVADATNAVDESNEGNNERIETVRVICEPDTYEDWPMFHHDPRHTGYSTSTAPKTNRILWISEIGDCSHSSPVVVNGKVFVGSDDGKIYCLNENDGSRIWVYETGGSVQSSPAVVDGMVFVGSTIGFYAFHEEDINNDGIGDLIWKNLTIKDLWSSPVVTNGKVFVGAVNTGNKFYCLDENTGNLIWSYETRGRCQTSPAVTDGKVFISPFWGGYIYCLDENTGNLIWKYKIGGYEGASSPTVVNDRVFVASYPGKVFCIDENYGSYIWSSETGGNSAYSTPAVAYGKVFVGSADGKTYCLDEITGQKLWSHETGGGYPVLSSPAVADGLVFVGSPDNKIYALSESNGDIVWSYATGDSVSSSPAIAKGKMFVGSSDGKVYCFGSKPKETEYWAVIVGVRKPGDEDAKDIYSALLSSSNWKDDHIRLLINEDATKDNIHSSIINYLGKADEDDVCLSYFSSQDMEV